MSNIIQGKNVFVGGHGVSLVQALADALKLAEADPAVDGFLISWWTEQGITHFTNADYSSLNSALHAASSLAGTLTSTIQGYLIDWWVYDTTEAVIPPPRYITLEGDVEGRAELSQAGDVVLSATFHGSGTTSDLKEIFDGYVEQSGEYVQEVAGYVEQVSGYGDQVFNLINDASGLVDQASGYVEQVSGHISQITGYVQVAGERVNAAAEYAEQADLHAQQANQSMDTASGFNNQAKTASLAAAVSAVAADGSAITASGYANVASDYANNASGFAETAIEAIGAAEGHSEAAGGYATQAAQSAQDAATSAADTINNPMATEGDMLVGGVGGAPERLATGQEKTVLTMVNGSPTWSKPVGGSGANLIADGSFEDQQWDLSGSHGQASYGVSAYTGKPSIVIDSGLPVVLSPPNGVLSLSPNRAYLLGCAFEVDGGQVFNGSPTDTILTLSDQDGQVQASITLVGVTGGWLTGSAIWNTGNPSAGVALEGTLRVSTDHTRGKLLISMISLVDVTNAQTIAKGLPLNALAPPTESLNLNNQRLMHLADAVESSDAVNLARLLLEIQQATNAGGGSLDGGNATSDYGQAIRFDFGRAQ